VTQLELAHIIPGRVRVRCPRSWLAARADVIGPKLRETRGVRDVRVAPHAGSVVVVYDPRRASADQILADLGRTPAARGRAEPPARDRIAPNGHGSRDDAQPLGLPSWLVLAGTSAALGASLAGAPAAAVLALTAASSAPSVIRAGHALAAGRLDVHVLQGLGLALLSTGGNLRAASLLAWFDSLGRFLLDLTVTRARRSLRKLLVPPGRSVVRLDRGRPSRIAIADLAPGHLVRVGAGERLPADGVVADGEALVDQQAITGEGLPVERRAGDRVFAWSLLQEGRLVVRVEQAGSDTVVGRIIEAVEASTEQKAELQVFAERLANRLVLRTLGLGLVGSLITRRPRTGISILVADYGLAARVAVPVAVLTAIIRASRAGILAKSPQVIEDLARVDTVVFDKTGTLTRGAPDVSRVVAWAGTEEPEHVLRLAAAGGEGVPHPVARAVARAAARRRIAVGASPAELRAGLGVQLVVDGVPVLIGSRRFMQSEGVPMHEVDPHEEAAHASGGAVTYVAHSGRLAGLLVLHDELRPDAPRAVADLRARRMRDVIMVSGDHPEPTRAIAERLGIERWHAEMLPEDKAALVERLRAEGRVVAMVGDGANDALALKAAQVGIGVQGGVEVVSEAAGVVLLRGGLDKVVEALDIARDGIAAVERGLDAAIEGNAAAITLSSLGLVGPFGSILVGHGAAIGGAVLAFWGRSRPPS
jgi:cation-transporting P-type ATPase C